MSRIIKSYSRFNSNLRDEIYTGYSESDLERTTFPYKGNIVDGVIYHCDDMIYLIPISSIVAGRSGSSDDIDHDDELSEIAIEVDKKRHKE